MSDVVEIEFKGRRKEYAANPLQFPFAVGDLVIVEVERGQDLGRIHHLGWRGDVAAEQTPQLRVVRRAGPADLRIVEQNRARECEARQIAWRKIQDHHLEMKLVDVELQWDGRKMTFHFTADGRVDFRELVKDLAATFRTRIDLRQIGARDETKRTGGYAICGQPLCCAMFLAEFKPITTQMPRDQFLPLNPAKLSGLCGRLKCCLRYELDVYRDFQRTCPKVGHCLRDEAKGEGEIEKLDVIHGQVHIKYDSGATEKMSPQEFAQLSTWKPEMPKNECICILGRRAPAAATPEPSDREREEAVCGPAIPGAERVVLLAGGGLGMQTGENGAEIRVGTDLDVAPAAEAKKKRKRRRSRKKRPSQPGDSGPTSPPEGTP